MINVAGSRRSPQVWLLTVAVMAAAVLMIVDSMAIAEEGAATGKKWTPEDPANPSYQPAPAWLPKPVAVPNAEATNEAQMKGYTEVVSGTLGAQNKPVTFDMVPIPSGKFKMGATEAEFKKANAAEDNPKYDEGPQHEVNVEPFWMGKFEVTWEEYEQWSMQLDKTRREATKGKATSRDEIADAIVWPTKPYTDMSFGMGKDGYPAICMTQIAAQSYCKWLSAKTGRYYRLPTEAEWEYACRAGTTTAYSWGDDPAKANDYAWHAENSKDKYHKVGEKKPNPWGLYDIHGNINEWTLDFYYPDFYAKATAKNPLAVGKNEYPRVVRGGGWDAEVGKLRSAARLASNKDWKAQDPQIPQSIWYLTDANFVGCRVIRPLRVPTAEEAKLYEPDPEVLQDFIKAQAGKQ